METPAIRNNIKKSFYSRWGRVPTEDQVDEIIRERIEAGRPQRPDTPSFGEQLLYGIGGQALAGLAGAYTQGLGAEIADKGFYDALFGEGTASTMADTGLSDNFFARLYEDSLAQEAIESAYQDSIVQDLVTSLFG